jgi:hypothetical protein
MHFLGSANPYLREIILAALHERPKPEVWERLLHCLGEHCWGEATVGEKVTDPIVQVRLQRVIEAAFLNDKDEAEGEQKTRVLHQGLSHSAWNIRQSAAYLLGLRADAAALPVLLEIIDHGELSWQYSAIEALVHLNVPGCGSILLEALEKDSLHQTAGRAIRKIAVTIGAALKDALNHANPHVRWHAARDLLEIGDRRGLDIVADGLFDDKRAVRWASAEALAACGEDAIPIILSILCRPGLSQMTLEAVGHACRSIQSARLRKRLRPLLKALRNQTSSSTITSVARQLMSETS